LNFQADAIERLNTARVSLHQVLDDEHADFSLQPDATAFDPNCIERL
jgi:hypothetical protein